MVDDEDLLGVTVSRVKKPWRERYRERLRTEKDKKKQKNKNIFLGLKIGKNDFFEISFRILKGPWDEKYESDIHVVPDFFRILKGPWDEKYEIQVLQNSERSLGWKIWRLEKMTFSEFWKVLGMKNLKQKFFRILKDSWDEKYKTWKKWLFQNFERSLGWKIWNWHVFCLDNTTILWWKKKFDPPEKAFKTGLDSASSQSKGMNIDVTAKDLVATEKAMKLLASKE